MDDQVKTLCLTEELNTATQLIISGFGELQLIRMDNDFYHLPQQLLASGFERLLKCYFCAVYQARNGNYPDMCFLKDLGHDLQKLVKTLTDDYFNASNVPLMVSDLDYLKTDSTLSEIIRILSEFGMKARYYNLDIVAGSNQPSIDPDEDWEAMERRILDPLQYLGNGDDETLYRDYYPKVNALIIAKLERLFRAIAMQFTRGNHGGRLRQLSPILGKFVALEDTELGTIDYRKSTKDAQNSQDTWVKRTKHEALESAWPSKLLNRENYGEKWPFRTDEVVIECRERMFCVVNINGYDFALNGLAKSRFGYPNPHDVGMAILGISIGPFLDMARELTAD